MSTGILTLQPIGLGSSQRTGIFIDGVQAYDHRNSSDLDLCATSRINVAYSGYTTNSDGSVTFNSTTVTPPGGVATTVTTTIRKIADNIWVKEVILQAVSASTIFIENWITGTALSYYNFKNAASGSPLGADDHGFFLVAGLQYNANNVMCVMPDNGWAARYNLGETAPNSAVSSTSSNLAGCTYGYAASGANSLHVGPTPITLRFFYTLAPADRYNFQLVTQCNWAVAQGCPSTDQNQRLLWVNAYASIRTLNVNDQRIFAHPSQFYPMAQWMRDAFWTTMSIPDSAICNGIFQIFYNIVDWADGLCGSIFKDDDVTVWDRAFDDSLPLFLVWAYWLNLKFGLTLLTTSELNILAGSIKNNISTFGRYRNYMKTGVIKLVNSFDDGLFPGTTYGETAYNQGWCWVALKSAQALGATVSAGDLTAAQNAYKGFFHQADQHISMAVIDGTDLNLVGSMDLIPEAWAQMLFGTSVLGSTIVAAQWNILQSGKILDGFKCTAHVNGAFVTEAIWRGYGSTPATSPKGGGQNGAIWFMLDFCCIYAAKFNGVISSSTATALYNARVSRELALLPSFQEYLLTDSEAITTNYNGGTWYNLGLGASASPIYGWNAAVLSFLPSFLAADSTTTTTTTTGSPTSSTTTTTGSPTTTTTSAPTTTTHAPTTTTTTAAPFMTPSFLVQPYQSGAVGGSVTISFWITGSAGDTFSIYDENPIFGDGGYAQATGVLPNQLQSITIGGVGSPYSTDWLRAISEHTGRSADSSTYSAAPGTTTTTTTTTAAPTTSTTSTTSGPTTTTTTTAGPTTNTTTSAPLLAPILSATAGPGRVTVSWPSVSGALSYNIYATADGSAPTLASAKQAGVTSPRVYSGLNPAVVYKYAATSVNSSGVESALGSVVSATPFAATTTTTPSSFPLAINVGGQILRFAETPGGALRIVIAGQVLQFALGDAGAVKVVTPQGTKCLN